MDEMIILKDEDLNEVIGGTAQDIHYPTAASVKYKYAIGQKVSYMEGRISKTSTITRRSNIKETGGYVATYFVVGKSQGMVESLVKPALK